MEGLVSCGSTGIRGLYSPSLGFVSPPGETLSYYWLNLHKLCSPGSAWPGLRAPCIRVVTTGGLLARSEHQHFLGKAEDTGNGSPPCQCLQKNPAGILKSILHCICKSCWGEMVFLQYWVSWVLNLVYSLYLFFLWFISVMFYSFLSIDLELFWLVLYRSIWFFDALVNSVILSLVFISWHLVVSLMP